MARYLIQTTEVYRADNEAEAKAVIEEEKEEGIRNLKKYNCEQQNEKAKGEIIQEWYRVTLTKAFTDEKEPTESVAINYEI